MKKCFLLTLLLMASLLLMSCLSSVATPAPAEVSMLDRSGNSIIPPEYAERIISMSPSITHVLVALGLGENIVGIDEYSVGIEGLPENLPMFDMMYPDAEKMLVLSPDIVLSTGMSAAFGDNPFKPLIDAGVCITSIPSADSIEGIKEDIRFIGTVTNTSDEADMLISEFEAEIEAIAAIGESISEKKTVYFEIAAAPDIYSFGDGVFQNEMIEVIGAVNVFAHIDGWTALSEENVIAANPDVILTNVNYIDDAVSDILGRNGWQVITAVKNSDVYYIDCDASSQPCQNIIEAIREMAISVYPEYYE